MINHVTARLSMKPFWPRWHNQWRYSRVFQIALYLHVDERGALGASSRTSKASTSWWRHQMETFSALLALCAENSPVPGEFPAQRPVTRSFNVFFDLRLNEQLSKQSQGWWSETPPRSLWRQCNVRNECGYRNNISRSYITKEDLKKWDFQNRRSKVKDTGLPVTLALKRQ